MSINRVPPNDIEAEKAVIGTCLFGTDHIYSVVGNVKPEHFYNNHHKAIFKEIEDASTSGDNVDIVTIANRLKRKNILDQAGGLSYLASLTSDVIPGFVDDYCRIIKSMSTSRAVIKESTDIITKAFGGAKESELVDSVNTLAMSLNVEEAKKASSMREMIPDALEYIKECQENDNTIGIPSGITDLDAHTGGFKPSNFVLLAGRPGMGKTSFALKILREAGRAGKRCLIFSLEMTKRRLVNRMISSESRVPGKNMERGMLNQNDWPKINSAASKLGTYDIIIDDSTSLTAGEITSRAKKHAIEKPIDLIVIDYIQLIKSSGGENRHAEITKISASLLALCKDLDAHVMVLSQLNRGCEQRTNKRPVPSDLKESGSLEENADIVLLLYRDEVYNDSPDNTEKGIAEIIIGKGRDIGQRTIKSLFVGDIANFENLHNDGGL